MDNQFSFEGSPMPPAPEQQKKKQKDSYATAGLVLGIVALVLSCPCCCCLYPVAGICAILAIVFSSISLKRSGKSGKAIAGLILGIVALLIVIIVIIAMVASPSTSDPDATTQQIIVDKMYEWIKSYAGEEAADEWYRQMMEAMKQNGTPIQPRDTGIPELE